MKISRLWIGRILTTLATAPFLMGVAMTATKNPQAAEGMGRLGWPAASGPMITTLMVVCVGLYLIPATSVLGMVLLTGYLGGAVASHLRVGESPAAAVIVGILAWGGLYLREPRLSALLPIRRAARGESSVI